MDGKITKIMFLAIFAAFMLAMPVFADLSVTNSTVLPSTLRPGVKGVVSMTLSNTGSVDIQSVQVEAAGTGYIFSEGQIRLGDYKAGTYGSATIPFSVPQDTPAGIYYLTVRFSWINASGTSYKNVQVPITVTNPAIFSIDSLNKSIYTTGDFEVGVKLSNSGGDARDIRASINSTQFFQSGPNPLTLGDLPANSSYNFPLGISLASSVTSGTYSVPILITYTDEASAEVVSVESLRLNVKRKSPTIELSLDGAQPFNPGHSLTMKLKVTNSGTDTAHDVQVGVAGASAYKSATGIDASSVTDVLTSLGTPFANLGDIAPDNYKIAVLPVGVNDVQAGFYRQYMSIKSKDDNGDAKADELQPLGINVEGVSDVSVFVSAKPAPIVAGSDNTLSVLVSNIGSSPIKALIVKIDGKDFVLQEAQDEQFIGGLAEDDFSTVQYKVKVANVPTSVSPLNVSMRFKDSYNRDYNRSQIVQLKILSPSDAGAGAQGGVDIFMLIIVLVIIGAAVWHFFLRKKGATTQKEAKK
ncbi:MAG: hypothetical protein WC492_00725 [Candidatus Micrarchaeia archaeon]